MKLPIVLACALPNWLGTARLPNALSRARFAVTLLAPRDALVARSRFVERQVLLRSGWNRSEWIEGLRAAIDASSARVVIPGDEIALHTMIGLALSPPDRLAEAERARLSAVVQDSLGDPAHFQSSTDKVELAAMAEAAGVPVPPYARIEAPGDAGAVARDFGWPLVLKAPHGFSGDGVAICRDADDLAVALSNWEALLARHPHLRGRPFIGQRYIEGPTISRTSLAWRGAELAGTTREKLVRHPASTGPATVVRYFHHPRVAHYSQRLIEVFAISGFAGIEYIVDREGGVHLLEINRRVTPGAAGSALAGVDLCAALHAAMTGSPCSVPRDLTPGSEQIIVRFPQEWLRDPASEWLRRYPVDVPWDDPQLLSAMLAMRRTAHA